MRLFLSVALLVFFLAGCVKQEQPVSFQVLQINDVYEIGKIQKGKFGGLARVATLKKQLLAQNPNTFAVIAGDFLNPSVIGTIKQNGERIKGKQMVDALNVMGLDYAVFGNHEFDLEKEELIERIKLSEFKWFTSNVELVENEETKPFNQLIEGKEVPFPKHVIWEISGGSGNSIKVGVISVTLQDYPKDYLKIEDMIPAAQREVEKLKGKVDGIIAITHQSIDEDRALAKAIPELKLIMGGHEHESHFENVGEVVIAKADANALTAFVHTLTYFPGEKRFKVASKLTKIDGSIPDDPATAEVVAKWEKVAESQMMANGINPNELLLSVNSPLDGLEKSVRNHSTNLTRMIAKAMFEANPEADFTLFNAGSIRVDDQLSGDLTQYDVVRILPFGGETPLVEIKGSLITKIVEAAKQNAGSGGLLHYHNLTEKGENILIQGTPVNPKKWYKAVITEFLLTGKERNLEFLTLKNPEIRLWKETEGLSEDIQKTLIFHLKSLQEEKEVTTSK